MKRRKFLLILNSFWAIPLVLILRFINQFKKICIIKIRSDRFGHFAPDGAEQVARFQMEKKEIFIYVFDYFICNQQWAKMLKQALPVYNFFRPVYFWNQFLPGNKSMNKTGTKTLSRDTELLFTKYNVKLPFEKDDEFKAKSWLKSKGWIEGEPFYCILIRDNAYLDKTSNFNNLDWSYHDYRNSKLETYYKAISWLTEKGVWVIRMGKIVETPIAIHNKRVVDFPFEKGTSDLIDTWLFTNCDGCISTGTGPDLLTGIYGKKILFLNYLPLGSIRSDLNSLTYPKKLIWKETSKPFKMDDYILDRRFHSILYSKDMIKIIDLTEDEILETTKEYYNSINKEKVQNKVFTKKQRYFWKKLLTLTNKDKYYNKIHPESQVSITWLKSLEKNT
ncbi:TIGR04372 family glycosyltransferase [Pseudomonadota bacterium]|nr:TIGR04372 family glycosyltransferase [Pseudomonadota bacterium]